MMQFTAKETHQEINVGLSILQDPVAFVHRGEVTLLPSPLPRQKIPRLGKKKVSVHKSESATVGKEKRNINAAFTFIQRLDT